ncbi:lysophospholipase 1 [Trichomonascus vanleenenianus]|uniref:lysophospholipase 1 n=1 Tax=Trichomonascus vanleenenianus TaxID=2268995 RepID=UPI003ECB2BDC
MLHGAGALAAMDERTENSTLPGHLGGLLQASTYITGLSGGSWLLGSLYMNEFPPIRHLQGSKTVWDLSSDLVFPNEPVNYWTSLLSDVKSKSDARFSVSLTDVWGRALSYKFFSSKAYATGERSWSGIQQFPWFRERRTPFPIVVANGRDPGTIAITENSTLFEVTPFEIGSYDKNLYSFSDLRYLGTHMSNGIPVNDRECVVGFDDTGFIIGTSSSVFNKFLLSLAHSDRILKKILYSFAKHFFDTTHADVAIYNPNPFYEYSNPDIDDDEEESSVFYEKQLFLVDGGEDMQNIPLQPLLHRERNVDVIFAFDNSADTEDNFPDGSSLAATFNRQFGKRAGRDDYRYFPNVPAAHTLPDERHMGAPTFFGCELDDESSPSPMVVYLPNSYYTFPSNTSTLKMRYSTKEVAGLINNGYNVMTQLNGTADSDWHACVSCAILRRPMQRMKANSNLNSPLCTQCFARYCYS